MRRASPTRQTERVLVYAIVRAAEGLVDGEAGYTWNALADTVNTRRAWLRRRASRLRRRVAA